MANKHRGEPRMRKLMKKLIREGLCNQEVLAAIRHEFPQHKTRAEQVRACRSELRRWDQNVLTSVEARHRRTRVPAA
jgi:hypothetical protein